MGGVGGLQWLLDGLRDLTPPVVLCLVLSYCGVFWVVWCMLLTMLHVEGDMVWMLGCAVVVIGQPVHHNFIVHSSFSVPMA